MLPWKPCGLAGDAGTWQRPIAKRTRRRADHLPGVVPGAACGQPDGKTPYLRIGSKPAIAPRLFAAGGRQFPRQKGHQQIPCPTADGGKPTFSTSLVPSEGNNVVTYAPNTGSTLALLRRKKKEVRALPARDRFHPVRHHLPASGDASEETDDDGPVDKGSTGQAADRHRGRIYGVFKVMQRDGSIAFDRAARRLGRGIIEPLTKTSRIRASHPHPCTSDISPPTNSGRC